MGCWLSVGALCGWPQQRVRLLRPACPAGGAAGPPSPPLLFRSASSRLVLAAVGRSQDPASVLSLRSWYSALLPRSDQFASWCSLFSLSRVRFGPVEQFGFAAVFGCAFPLPFAAACGWWRAVVGLLVGVVGGLFVLLLRAAAVGSSCCWVLVALLGGLSRVLRWGSVGLML